MLMSSKRKLQDISKDVTTTVNNKLRRKMPTRDANNFVKSYVNQDLVDLIAGFGIYAAIAVIIYSYISPIFKY